jgi:hypothetical protein
MRHYPTLTTARLGELSRPVQELRTTRVGLDIEVSTFTWTAAANGSNRIALGCPLLPLIGLLTCVNDPY